MVKAKYLTIKKSAPIEDLEKIAGFQRIQLSDTDMKNWHLRLAVTPNCNFKCLYCKSDGHRRQEEMPVEEYIETVHAAAELGIRRAHLTGGEPTLRKDLPNIIQAGRDAGFTEQIITTNGWNLTDVLDEYIDAGLTRVIVSLDTLDESRYLQLTGLPFLERTVAAVEDSVKKLESTTKISCVTMETTLPELQSMIYWANKLNQDLDNKGSLTLKLNQFFPSNPAQLSPDGETYWREEVVDEIRILETLSKVGDLKPIKRTKIQGDNPAYNYYEVGDTGVNVAVLALYSWEYGCGRCHKLRILPNGEVSVCLNLHERPNIRGKKYEEKVKILKSVIDYRINEHDKMMPTRKHYNPHLGEVRFGICGNAQPMSHFYKDKRKAI